MPYFVTAVLLLVCSVGFIAVMSVSAAAGETEDVASLIISSERAALDRWSKGDPDGFLDISDASVVYFDPFVPKRVNNKEELRKLYEGIRGKFTISNYEMLDPKVQVSGEMAVLTFNFVSHGTEGEVRWNSTEVYQRQEGKWRIIHTHWSLTQPALK